ncbi:hypothetical protein SPRG_13187 [Saprolegnia parasitica CBS 223.65]|uniref:Potassium channel domain-containing protein n=1 Tax=Saprolegnia parasitica (strain CBS 223.65) TaxID=695850 RepID=A0A067BU45_SAPPC|nr:hypothetical protein SPRG_13187 [Saprolegnia parasitica CBS 223.65]KDO21773.1 hypothetical protein SPRG_13187 [Saprolegnia parasitica CBS 223.65]|eukprot:XP_012207573.1 hypothetical protein SPRG_13187 [Saprolegnia parasitica CBS 223.65]
MAAAVESRPASPSSRRQSSPTKSSTYMEQLKAPAVLSLFQQNDTIKHLETIHLLKREYRNRQLYEIWSFAIAMVGIVLMLATNEELMERQVAMSPAAERIKVATSATTLVLLILLVKRYQSHTSIYKMQNILPPRSSMLREYWRVLLLELLICGFHIPPGVHGVVPMMQFRYTLNANSTTGLDTCAHPKNLHVTVVDDGCYLDYTYTYDTFGVLMVLRLYLFGRYMRSSSPLYSQWARTLKNVNTMDPFFHFKAIFSTKPLRLVLPLLFFVTFLTAAILRILEVPAQPYFMNYWTSVWLTIVTITSVGYGDYVPATHCGRFFMAFSGILGGLLILSLVQSIFFAALALTENESRVKYIIDQTRWEKARRHAAAGLIQTQFRLVRTRRAGHDTTTLSFALYAYMAKVHQFARSEPSLATSFEEEMDRHMQRLLNALGAMQAKEDALMARIHAKTLSLDGVCDTLLPNVVGSS